MMSVALTQVQTEKTKPVFLSASKQQECVQHQLGKKIDDQQQQQQQYQQISHKSSPTGPSFFATGDMTATSVVFDSTGSISESCATSHATGKERLVASMTPLDTSALHCNATKNQTTTTVKTTPSFRETQDSPPLSTRKGDAFTNIDHAPQSEKSDTFRMDTHKPQRRNVESFAPPEIDYVERVVEVPHVEYVDRHVEKELVQEVIHEVARPKLIYDIPLHRYRQKVDYVDVEKIVEVPGEIVHVPRPITNGISPAVEQVKRYKDIEVPVVVAQTIRPVVTHSDEIVDIEVFEYEPEIIPVDVHVATPVPSKITTRGAVHEAHGEVKVPPAQYNTILRALNKHLDEETLPYRQEGNKVQFLEGHEAPGFTILEPAKPPPEVQPELMTPECYPDKQWRQPEKTVKEFHACEEQQPQMVAARFVATQKQPASPLHGHPKNSAMQKYCRLPNCGEAAQHDQQQQQTVVPAHMHRLQTVLKPRHSGAEADGMKDDETVPHQPILALPTMMTSSQQQTPVVQHPVTASVQRQLDTYYADVEPKRVSDPSMVDLPRQKGFEEEMSNISSQPGAVYTQTAAVQAQNCHTASHEAAPYRLLPHRPTEKRKNVCQCC